MAITSYPVRHELKYLVHPAELHYLRSVLDGLLMHDPNGDENNEYHIRSLYFDSVHDDALHEKIAGVGNRKKYRIRIYNFSDRLIRLECKRKIGDLISKQSVRIPRDLAEQIIAGDPSGLEYMRHPLLREMFVQMRTNLLHPVVIVDYVREAYITDAQDVRITFDRRLRTGLYSSDLFNPRIPTFPVFDDCKEILEVKFDQFLPAYLQTVLSGVTAERSAVSKYVHCRRYEEKEF
ncbi:MAG TPA: polyphosphate polymerase domain-containing protein [Candidatus Onthenecus intestinigallinarum]|mgnify:CR=1 FL=1|uniref:Polyphosphate polymerase domain-containing protein n=1 Tax=Candidatus Onthenecus intestinigallinarum TaxID=2840875 RepID=A0A9D0ZBB7_9FIRM|nr:polyphosphate polymerase domain-containing protein [Candidatus Onthenecus intestinigallinarum]